MYVNVKERVCIRYGIRTMYRVIYAYAYYKKNIFDILLA